jgi:hypothetical protein
MRPAPGHAYWIKRSPRCDQTSNISKNYCSHAYKNTILGSNKLALMRPDATCTDATGLLDKPQAYWMMQLAIKRKRAPLQRYHSSDRLYPSIPLDRWSPSECPTPPCLLPRLSYTSVTAVVSYAVSSPNHTTRTLSVQKRSKRTGMCDKRLQ